MMHWQDEFEIVSVDGKVSAYTKDGIASTSTVENEISDNDRIFYEEIWGD